MPSSRGEASHTDAGRGGAAGFGYETRDANTSAVLAFLAVLFLVLTLILFGTWRLFRRYAVAEQGPAPASPFANVRQIPPGPDLEVNGRADLMKIYAKQQRELETYSWEDRKAGTVRVPIERAMDLLLQKGLPVVSSGAKDEAAPGDSASKNLNDTASAPGTQAREVPKRK
jgi:hypothetical protein